MAQGEHSHWTKYHVRIIKTLDDNDNKKEVLQCICISDGEIFHEVDVVKLPLASEGKGSV